MLAHRNAAYSKWIGTGNLEDLFVFKRTRGEVKRAVREAKNRWFQEKATTVAEGHFGVSKYGTIQHSYAASSTIYSCNHT